MHLSHPERRAFFSLFCNVATVIWVIYSILSFFTGEGSGNMDVHGPICFRYFTIDSNVLAAVAAALLIPYNVRALVTGREEYPAFALAFKFVGTVAVALTFFTVVGFLGPTQGYEKMFAGVCFYLHASVPVFCILSFALCETAASLPRRAVLLGLIPTAVYGAVYVVMVLLVGVENGGWEDFYGFNMGGFWYISIVAMLAVTALIAAGIHLAHNAAARHAGK